MSSYVMSNCIVNGVDRSGENLPDLGAKRAVAGFFRLVAGGVGIYSVARASDTSPLLVERRPPENPRIQC